MPKLTYEQKKQAKKDKQATKDAADKILKDEKVAYQNQAYALLNNAMVSSVTRKNMTDKIKSNHNAKIKSVIDTLTLMQQVEKPKKGVHTLKDIVKNKQVEALLKDAKIEAFNKKILLKTGEILAPYKKKTMKQLNYRHNGNRFVQVMIKQKMDKEEIKNLGTKISRQFFDTDHPGSFVIAVKTDYGWRSPKMQNFGDNAAIYDPSEYDEDDDSEICIYFIEEQMRPNRAGGATDKNNNCLYDCLKSVLYSKMPFDSPEDLKKYLKINVQAAVSIDDIPKIEKALKTYKINVSGDYTYISTISSVKIINLKLLKGHYTIVINDDSDKLNKDHVSYTKRRVLIYDKLRFVGFDGEVEIPISKQFRSKIYHWNTPYILINREDYKLTMKENYDIFVKDAKQLNNLSSGAIDLFKTGSNKLTALNLFDKYSKYIPNAQHIGQLEAEWINEASSGAITFARPYEGPGYYFDIKSMYPSIMKSTQVFPIKEGEFKIIDKVELFKNIFYFTYGIYRCTIEQSNDANINKFFRFNKTKKYTHIDLANAHSLGLSINLIQDGKANFLYYSRDKCLAASEMFSEFVDVLFVLKESKIKRAKSILNILWGALSEHNKTKVHATTKKGDKVKQTPSDYGLLGLRPYNDNETIIETTNNNAQYKTGFARLKPFLLARGRANIAKIMLPFKETVMRCHTDGFICSERPEGIITGNGLGDLVNEGKKTKIKITTCRKAIILID